MGVCSTPAEADPVRERESRQSLSNPVNIILHAIQIMQLSFMAHVWSVLTSLLLLPGQSEEDDRLSGRRGRSQQSNGSVPETDSTRRPSQGLENS